VEDKLLMAVLIVTVFVKSLYVTVLTAREVIISALTCLDRGGFVIFSSQGITLTDFGTGVCLILLFIVCVFGYFKE
jgi:hypothetical protein